LVQNETEDEFLLYIFQYQKNDEKFGGFNIKQKAVAHVVEAPQVIAFFFFFSNLTGLINL